jgi:hypothetical protein
MRVNRALRVLCLSVLSVAVWAQAPSGDSAAQASGSTEDLQQLRERIAKQEEQIKKLQESIDQQRTLLEKALRNQPAPSAATGSPAPAPMPAAPTAAPAQPATAGLPATPGSPAKIVPVSNIPVKNVANGRYAQHNETAPSPLSISLGNTTLTPLGFMDATFFWRSTAIGSGIGTNFPGAPFNNVPNGHLSETNFSAQNSRIGFRVDSTFMGWKVLGYLETDFLFNNDANSYQITSNSAGLRLRNYFVDLNNGEFEVLGGQDWSFLTPNRKGLSPLPSDIFYSQNMDTNYQVGLVWTRAPQFRFIAHPSENVAFGVAFENPQQYIGGGNGSGAVTIPSFLNSQSTFTGQFQSSPGSNVGNEITNVPNLMPNIIPKVAFDGKVGDRAMHLELAGVVAGYKDNIPNTSTFTTNPYVRVGSHSTFGFGGELNSNLELFKNFHLIENVYVSSGVGRYLFGMAPDVAIRPDGTLSPIHSAGTVDGFEYQVTPNNLFAMYYGGVYVGRNVIYDPTASGSTLAKPVYAGYGFVGSGGTQNRDIQEITFDWVRTLWKNPNYGALSMINQYSYLFREPWYSSASTPRQAHSSMIWIDLRYTLP